MDSKSITRAQASELFDHLHPMAVYLAKVLKRMEQRKFPEDDPLYRRTKRARQALMLVVDDLYTMYCDHTRPEGKRRAK
jgi:hypothetical protein